MSSVQKIANRQVQYLDLGRTDYKECWDFQTRLFEEIVATKIANRDNPSPNPTRNYLIFCEHPHVYTLGKSGKESNLLITKKQREELDIQYFPINRGGDITYHGPGQLVGYPIFDLGNFFTDIHKYLRLLEEGVIRTIADFGIQGTRIDGLTGVWVGAGTSDPRKICALGVKASRWVTMHGFALNVNTDLSYFNHIVPCGIDDKAVTSMQQEIGQTLEINEVASRLKEHLAALFEFEYIDES